MICLNTYGSVFLASAQRTMRSQVFASDSAGDSSVGNARLLIRAFRLEQLTLTSALVIWDCDSWLQRHVPINHEY